jgi:ABC-type transporter Mla MlaB component
MQPDGALTTSPAAHGVKHLALDGPLTMNTVGAWYARLNGPFEGKSLVLDLSKVTDADSSGLALITAIKRTFSERSIDVTLQSVPQSLTLVADIYDAADVLTSIGSSSVADH